MKKIISIMTAMVMTVCILSCTVPLVYAENSAETASGTELAAGNISDKQLKKLIFELAGDSIKFSSRYCYYGGELMIATNDKFTVKTDAEKRVCYFKPESNGKYMIILMDSQPEEYITFAFDYYYYVLLVECHDNVVDIDVNNMYSLETDFSKYGAAPIVITSLATEKSYAVSIDSQAMDTALGYLMTGFFIESDCFGVYGISFDTDRIYYTPAFIVHNKNCKLLSADIERLNNDDSTITDFTMYNFPVINCDKPASGLLVLMPRNYKYKEEGINLIKADGDIIKKIHFDLEIDKKHDSKYCLIDSLKETLLPKNDINYDGELNVADAVILSKYLHGTGEMNKVNAWLADICRDGTLDVFDLCMLKKELVK